MQISSINYSTNFGTKFTPVALAAINNGLSVYNSEPTHSQYKSCYEYLKNSAHDCTLDINKDTNSITVTFPVTKDVADLCQTKNNEPYIGFRQLEYIYNLISGNVNRLK